jgi:hypothetical protein
MYFLEGKVEGNGLLKIAAKATAFLTIALVIAAVLSQFSAAVADVVGGGRTVAESTAGKIDERRAFAFYYFLQCLVAISVTRNKGKKLPLEF